MKKRGLGHVEAILSFVIFIGFLIFAFFFFSPFSGNRVLDSSIDYTFREIDGSVSVTMESYSVVINEEVTDNRVWIKIDASVQNARARVEDSDGNELDSGMQDNKVFFDRTGNDFVIIRFSEDFVNGGLSEGTEILSEEYSISSSDRKRVYSEIKFLELNDSYYDDYEGLKKEFNLPNRVDFSFILDFGGDDEISATRFIPEELEVIASQERVEVLRTGANSGSTVFADLIISVW